jgi:hypothetical protein
MRRSCCGVFLCYIIFSLPNLFNGRFLSTNGGVVPTSGAICFTLLWRALFLTAK